MVFRGEGLHGSLKIQFILPYIILNLKIFPHQKKSVVIVLVIIFMVFTTRAEKSNACEHKCGGYTVQYPFGFSEGCEIKLNCSSGGRMEIGGLQVNEVTSSSIFINVPWKCNRSMQSIRSLFSNNFAPTRKNSFLFQSCSSTLGGGGIPTTSLIGNQIELEDCNKGGDNIRFFKEVHRKNEWDVVSYEDMSRNQCKFCSRRLLLSKEETWRFRCSFRCLN